METALTPDMITQPELWRCVLQIGQTRLYAALVPPAPGEPPVWRSITLSADATSRLKAIEDAVYDNPLLLCDFRRIDVITDSERIAILPQCATPADDDQLIDMIGICTGSEPSEQPALCERVEIGGATFTYTIDSQLEAFLRRTFFGVHIHHPLAITAAETTALARNSTVMTVVADTPGIITVAAARDGNLLMANQFAYTHPIDAAYYVMASRATLALTPDSGTLRLCGTHHNLPNIAEALTPYVKNIERAVTPPRLCLLGKEAARFHHTITTLLTSYPCE